jgi:TrmH family RNA methyltransferase
VKLRPVLVRPLYAGNVGSLVRLAANFGLEELFVVSPACPLEGTEYRRMTMGGERHLNLRVTVSLDEAVAGSDVVVATTSGRARDPRQLLAPVEVRRRLEDSRSQRVAVLFGSERGGLSREELRATHMLLSVPANPAFPTLNVVQAAAIVLAVLREGSYSAPAPGDPLDLPAPAEQFDAALAHLQQVLLETRFLDPANPPRVMDQVRFWLGRSVPTGRELAILRGIAAHIAYLAGRSSGKGTER